MLDQRACVSLSPAPQGCAGQTDCSKEAVVFMAIFSSFGELSSAGGDYAQLIWSLASVLHGVSHLSCGSGALSKMLFSSPR